MARLAKGNASRGLPSHDVQREMDLSEMRGEGKESEPALYMLPIYTWRYTS